MRRTTCPSPALRSGRVTVKLRGSPVRGRAQGWRYAPPPSAASALPPAAPRSGCFARARRGAPSALLRARSWTYGGGLGRRVPVLLAGDHDVENDDELSQAGDEGNLWELSSEDEAHVVGLEGGVVLGGPAE